MIAPSVSCVMPTRNRGRFLPGAIKCFMDQDYQGDMELVILDDGNGPNIPPFHEQSNRRVHYVWRDSTHYGPLSTGIKRNLTNNLARGGIIVHWDDDDWSHPSRVRNQVEFLCGDLSRSVVGYHTFLYWREFEGDGFKYNDPGFRPHSGGSALCYRKAWWESHRFTNRAVGEDFLFCVEAKRTGSLASQDGLDMLVARIHGSNTCVPKFGSVKFPPVPRKKFPEGFLLTLA